MKTDIFLSALLALSVCTAAGADGNDDIVDISMVGAGAVTPLGIVNTDEAPFDICVCPPSFPDVTVTLTGADISGDGLITPAVNDIIARLSEQGGGTVVIPAGHWLSGRITLRSNVNLRIDSAAVVQFSGDIGDYLPAVFTRHEGVEVMGAGAFIYACDAVNIALTGKGTVCGPPLDDPMRSLANGNSVVEKDIDPLMPVEQRLCDGLDGRTFYRPKSFSPINCKGVLVEGITFERSVLWNVNPVYCDNVIIRGITVNSTDVPSGDGIDISSCSNVLIEYSTLNCGDDCFTMKAGRCEDGLRVGKPTYNVLIRYCLAKDGHGGITCGSETAGGMFDICLHHCVFDGTRTGFRFKTRRNRGGGIRNIVYDNVRLIGVREAFTWDLLGSEVYMGELARRNPPLDITTLTPVVRDMRISNFIVESADRLASVHGIPEIPCSDVVIENGTVNTGVIFKAMEDMDGMTLRNLTVNASDNNMTIDNSSNIVFDNVSFNLPDNALNLNIIGDNSSAIIISKNGTSRKLIQGINIINND